MVKRYKYLILASVFVAVFSLLPHFYSIYLAGEKWRGILPEYTNDGLYYYARMNDVGKGNIFLGNPYFLEHRGEPAPAFFVADWLASWPLFVGFSLEQTVYLNSLLWPLLFFLALFVLFRQIGLNYNFAVAGSLASYLSVSTLMARPVVMQVIFPFYVLFLIALVRYLKAPQIKSNFFGLVFIYAFSFYLYSYSWQVSVLTVLLLTLGQFVGRKWPSFFSLVLANVLALILASPIIWYTYLQVNNPFYWETLTRLGLVQTHWPTLLAVFDSGVAVLGLVSLFSFCRLARNENKTAIDLITSFFTLTGGALIIANFSNVITGQEIEISNHISRFITLWLSLLTVFLVFFLKENYRLLVQSTKSVRWFSGSLLVIFIIVLSPRIISSFSSLTQPLIGMKELKVKELQSVAGPLVWLERNAKPGSVIWADRWVSSYVPITTHHYVLFSPQGGLHLMSSAELEERYLVSGYFRGLTLEDIKNDFRSYAGVGNAIHQYKTNNRRVKLCQIFQLARIGHPCGKLEESGVSFRGEKYFTDLYQKYLIDIKPNINDKLTKYRVSYILVDRQGGQLKLPVKNITGSRLVYEDQRFVIYQIVRSF